MQQVNLYLNEFKRVEVPVSASIILIICGYIFCLGLLVSAALSIWLYFENQQAKQLTEQVAHWEIELEAVAKANPEPKPNDELIKEIKILEKKISVNQDVIAYLDYEGLADQNIRFSVFMQALSKTKNDKVWLSNVSIKNSGKAISLKGGALDVEAIPKYLSQLSEHSAFRSIEFEVFDIKREGKYVRFVLDSVREEDQDESYLEKLTF